MQGTAVQTGESKTFSASYDSMAKIVSAIVVLLFLGIVFASGSTIVAGGEGGLLFFAYAYFPRGYTALAREIVVKRPIGNVRISLEGIREARTTTADDLSGCIRLFGSGGLFGWYGLFRTTKLGERTWYVTNRSNAVVLITGARTVLVSPDDVDGFIGEIRTAMPEITPSDPLLVYPGSDALGTYPADSSIGKLLGWAVGIAGVSIAAVSMFYSPGTPSYTLTPEALTIHDRFYPVTVKAATVDVDHIRVVDFGVDTDWQPTRRTNGFGNPHYHAGWFPGRQRQDGSHVPRRQQAAGASPGCGQRHSGSSRNARPRRVRAGSKTRVVQLLLSAQD